MTYIEDPDFEWTLGHAAHVRDALRDNPKGD